MYYLMLDTETCNSIDDPLCYDIGFAIVDEKGKIYEKFSYIVKEIFLYEKELMKNAYFAEKIPQYFKEIWGGSRKVASLYEIKRKVWDCMIKYDTVYVVAHNMRFDYNSTNKTQRYLTKSKYRYFFPYGIEIWDTLKMANDILGKMPTYKKWCQVNGYTYGKDRCRMTAEIIYRFISGKENLEESHTGLEDVLIEKEILAYCYRQHKKMRKKLWENA